MQLKNIKYRIITLLLMILPFTNFSQSGIIDKIIGQVGEEIIMLSDIQKSKLQLIQEGEEVDDKMDAAILEELLYQKLLINQAKIDSIEVTTDRVNADMEQRIRYFESQIGGRDELEKFYGKSIAQIKAEFFNTIKERMLAEQMEAKITENLVITPNDISIFFNSLPKDSIPYINSKITVAQIVLFPEITEDDKIRALKKLESIRQDVIDEKMGFGTAALRYSEDPGSRIQEGDLGWQTKGTMVPEFEAAAFDLDKNGISPVFETQFGFHFLQLLERKGDNYHVRHILLSTKATENSIDVSASKLEKIYQDVIKKNMTFEESASKFSMDEASKNNGGKIVNPYTNSFQWDINNVNEIDPQLYRIINGLSAGRVSGLSLYENQREQKVGVRIVKLIEKTAPHIANLNDDYQLIQNACSEQKKQEIINRWIKSKIKSSYIRLDEKYLNSQFKYNWNKK